MKYKRKNLQVIKYKGFYGVDYNTSSLGKTLKSFPTLKLANLYKNRISKK